MGTDAHSRSVLWLDEAARLVPGAPCPPPTGSTTADICIVGGGFTGLWTALEIAELAPDSRVVLIEAGTCGIGASGRGGGLALSWYPKLEPLIARFGVERALWLADHSSRAIDRIGELFGERGRGDCFRREGLIWIASGTGQERELAAAAAACRRHGRGELVEDLDSSVVASTTGYLGSRGGLLIRDSAAVQPAMLVRLLREKALNRGVRIHESTAMVALERGRPPAVTTVAGRITADRIVIAINAWAGTIRELRRSIVAIASHLVLTEPLGDRIDSLEWSRGALLGDARLTTHFARVTEDGRIAFGRGGGVPGRGGTLLPRHFHDSRGIDEVAADFRRWFPQFADVRLTNGWSGPDDRAPGLLPFIGSLGDHENVHYGVGYSGNGIAPGALVGRILGRLALGIVDEYTTCGLVSGPPGYLPPESLRRIGGPLLDRAVRRIELRQEAGVPPGPIGRAAKRLSTLTIPKLRR